MPTVSFPAETAAVNWGPAVDKGAATGRLESVLDLAIRLTQASRGGVELLSGDPSAASVVIDGGGWVIGEPSAFSLAGMEFPSRWADGPSLQIPLAALARLVAGRIKSLRLDDASLRSAELGLPERLPFDGPFLAVPLQSHGKCQGILYLTRAAGQPPFTADDVDQVLALCRLLEQEPMIEGVDLVNQVHLLTRVAQAAAGHLELGRIFDVALHELERYLPMNACAVWLAEEESAGQLTLARVAAGDEGRSARLGLRTGLKIRLEQTPFGPCFRDGQAAYLDLRRPDEQSSELARSLAASGATYFFAVALRAGDRTVGVLQSICKRQTGFTGEQIQLLYRAADLLGPAISNCQLFARLKGAYEQLRLTQQQLIQSEKMRAIGELASGMAHDFNNSLCGVLGFLELALLEYRLPPGSRGYLERARMCAQDAAATVRRVQEFARRSPQELPGQATDLNELVRQTIELTRPRWESATNVRGRPVQVELRLEAKASVLASAAELREALTNLIFNAVDAMPAGGTLTLRTRSAGRDVFLEVQDTGVGMSEPVRRRLFEPFFTTKGEYGNGLGLSVTFGIVQRHGGEISVESTEGVGSTFRIRLPADRTGAPPSGPVPVVKASRAGKALRVLVVEDEESIRNFLRTALGHLGHQAKLAATAGEGMEALQKEAFDLVLTDLGLPDASGETVVEAAAKKAPGMPVMLLTGWADQLQAEKKCPAGVKLVLGKPITLDRLSQALAGVGTQY